jgi:hypothetical protein
MIKAYVTLAKFYRTYWHLYGGWRALLVSPYFHLAVIITALCAPIWLDNSKATIWSGAAINILPNLMGFSIAGMAIFLAFSNANTMRAVTEDGDPESYFVTTVANFFHFILVQTVALVLAWIGLYYTCRVLSGVGVLSLTYALLVSPAMAMQLLNTARVINAAESIAPKKKRNFKSTPNRD